MQVSLRHKKDSEFVGVVDDLGDRIAGRCPGAACIRLTSRSVRGVNQRTLLSDESNRC